MNPKTCSPPGTCFLYYTDDLFWQTTPEQAKDCRTGLPLPFLAFISRSWALLIHFSQLYFLVFGAVLIRLVVRRYLVGYVLWHDFVSSARRIRGTFSASINMCPGALRYFALFLGYFILAFCKSTKWQTFAALPWSPCAACIAGLTHLTPDMVLPAPECI